jgi:ABC-type multidrug transport system fused ATPase/permease subunit
MCDVWIARWANHGVRNFSDSSYALVYLGLVGTFTLLLFLRNIAFSWSMVRASTALHNNMFDKVLRAPMTFFWSNPSGRVLNRFSKDMDNIDKLMVRAAADWWNFSFIGIGAMVSIMVLLPWLLVILVPLMAVMYMITRYFFRASRQLKRLEAVTRSPVYQVG